MMTFKRLGVASGSRPFHTPWNMLHISKLQCKESIRTVANQTVCLPNIYLEVLIVLGKVLHLFMGQGIPLLLILMSHDWHSICMYLFKVSIMMKLILQEQQIFTLPIKGLEILVIIYLHLITHYFLPLHSILK